MENKFTSEQKQRLVAGVLIVLGVALVVYLILSLLIGGEKRSVVAPIDLTDDGRDAQLAQVANEEAEKIVNSSERSTLSGVKCDNPNRRPIAVMYSGDPTARAYFTNLSKADIVVEMPHRATHGGTRIMGIFQCEAPEAVGPMRSGRTDFIGMADAFDAIFVPWGGSGVAKGLLKQGVVDVIDCNGEVPPAGDAQSCFRRDAVGDFASVNKMNRAASSVPALLAQSERVGYRTTTTDRGLKRQTDLPLASRPEYGRLKIGFEGSYRVTYEYDRATNDYKRFFNKAPAIDYETKQQIAPKNVIVILAKKEAFRTDVDYTAKGLKDPWAGVDAQHRLNDHGAYPNFQLGDPWFDTVHEGEAYFYQNGKEIKGKWSRKKGQGNPFVFTTVSDEPIYFVEGSIWIEIPETGRKIKYTTEPSVE